MVKNQLKKLIYSSFQTNFFNRTLRPTGAFILLLKTIKSKLQCMNVDDN